MAAEGGAVGGANTRLEKVRVVGADRLTLTLTHTAAEASMPSNERTRRACAPSERAEAFQAYDQTEVPWAATSVPLSIEIQTAASSLRSSEAVPLIVEVAPTVSASRGFVTETEGGALGPRLSTTTPTPASAELPRSSVAVAERRWGPSAK